MRIDMAKHKGKKSGKGDDVIVISNEDWKGGKSFKTAPGGKYRFRFSKKSSIRPNRAGDGSVLNLISTITAMHNGKTTKHKGVNVFDNIAPHVGWKIAQILKAMGIKKPPKKMTLKELLSLIQKYDKEFRAVIGVRVYNGKKQNPVLQYLPLKSSDEEGDEDTEDDDDIDDDEDSDDEDSDDDDDESDDEDEDSDDDDAEENEEDDEDEDEDDDDEEEEEEKPRRGKAKSKKSRR